MAANKKPLDLSFLTQGIDTLELPSRGILYPVNSPLSKGKLKIRPWITAEEKLIDKFNKTNFYSILRRLVEAAVEENVDITEMTLGDFFFVLYNIRQLSYGAAYTTSVRCPHCNTDVETEVDLNNCEVTYLKEGFVEPIELVLPISKIEVKLRLPRLRDVIEATESTQFESKRYGSKINSDMYKFAKCALEMKLPNEDHDILTIDKDFMTELQLIWPKMPAADYAAIKNKLDEFDHGYIDTIQTKCPNCEEMIEQAPVLSPDFFRPSPRRS
jgi:uncharacterized protein (UPF0212 family)